MYRAGSAGCKVFSVLPLDMFVLALVCDSIHRILLQQASAIVPTFLFYVCKID